jgi:hypothetical protein
MSFFYDLVREMLPIDIILSVSSVSNGIFTFVSRVVNFFISTIMHDMTIDSLLIAMLCNL